MYLADDDASVEAEFIRWQQLWRQTAMQWKDFKIGVM